MNSTLKTQNAGDCTPPLLSPKPGLSPDSMLLTQSRLEGVGIGVLWRHVVQSDSAASSLHPGLSVAVKHKQLAVGLHNKQHRVSQSCHKHPAVSPHNNQHQVSQSCHKHPAVSPHNNQHQVSQSCHKHPAVSLHNIQHPSHIT